MDTYSDLDLPFGKPSYRATVDTTENVTRAEAYIVSGAIELWYTPEDSLTNNSNFVLVAWNSGGGAKKLPLNEKTAKNIYQKSDTDWDYIT